MNVKSIEKEGSKAKVVVEVEARNCWSPAVNKAYHEGTEEHSWSPASVRASAPRKMIEAMYGADVFYGRRSG